MSKPGNKWNKNTLGFQPNKFAMDELIPKRVLLAHLTLKIQQSHAIPKELIKYLPELDLITFQHFLEHFDSNCTIASGFCNNPEFYEYLLDQIIQFLEAKDTILGNCTETMITELASQIIQESLIYNTKALDIFQILVGRTDPPDGFVKRFLPALLTHVQKFNIKSALKCSQAAYKWLIERPLFCQNISRIYDMFMTIVDQKPMVDLFCQHVAHKIQLDLISADNINSKYALHLLKRLVDSSKLYSPAENPFSHCKDWDTFFELFASLQDSYAHLVEPQLVFLWRMTKIDKLWGLVLAQRGLMNSSPKIQKIVLKSVLELNSEEWITCISSQPSFVRSIA
jgi:hypothetical protein